MRERIIFFVVTLFICWRRWPKTWWHRIYSLHKVINDNDDDRDDDDFFSSFLRNHLIILFLLIFYEIKSNQIIFYLFIIYYLFFFFWGGGKVVPVLSIRRQARRNFFFGQHETKKSDVWHKGSVTAPTFHKNRTCRFASWQTDNMTFVPSWQSFLGQLFFAHTHTHTHMVSWMRQKNKKNFTPVLSQVATFFLCVCVRANVCDSTLARMREQHRRYPVVWNTRQVSNINNFRKNPDMKIHKKYILGFFLDWSFPRKIFTEWNSWK